MLLIAVAIAGVVKDRGDHTEAQRIFRLKAPALPAGQRPVADETPVPSAAIMANMAVVRFTATGASRR